MAYIIVLNPIILSGSEDVAGNSAHRGVRLYTSADGHPRGPKSARRHPHWCDPVGLALPDLSLVGAFSMDSFGRIGVIAVTMFVFTLVFANFFDAMGTFTGLSREAGLADEQGRSRACGRH